MTWANNALCAIASSMLTLFVTKAGPFHAANVNGKHLTTLGRPKATGEKAFMLSVGLKFTDNSSAETLLKAWGKAARYCIENEPFLFAYEVAQSDKDPLSYVILERYASKSDYLGAHRRSPAFKEFRPQMKALQDSGAVVVTGSSYDELGIGFT